MKLVDKLVRRIKLVYSFSSKERALAGKITASGFYFWILRKKIRRQAKGDENGPFNLVIETSSICNARCLMCPQSKMKRTKKVMDKKVFDLIIGKIKREKLLINKVLFSGMGEPLTDPRLLERMAAIKKMDLPVRLYTNASLMNKEIAQEMVRLGIDEVNISFNGASPAEYQKIMGLDFEKTVDKINYLIEARKKAGSSKPFIQISLIAIKENEKNIKGHLQSWRNKADSVTVSLAHRWGGGIKKSSKLKVKNSKLIYPCRSLWHTFMIDSRGSFVVCCRDYESKHILGSIKTHSFADIRKSPVLKKFRSLHLAYSWDKLPKMCRECNFPYQSGVEWFLPRSID